MSSEKTVKIACRGSTEVRIEDLEGAQGGMKSLTEENAARLRRNIERNGFSAPLAVWRRKGERTRVLDGHQRLKVLLAMRADGWDVPPVPAVEVEAKDEREAVRKLLAIASRFGDFDQAGLSALLAGQEDGLDGLAEEVRLLDVALRVPASEADAVAEDAAGRGKGTDVRCPNCGAKYEEPE